MVELVGQRLGQYQIIEQIAKGGMATVYRATQTSIGRDVAIKVLPQALTHDDTFLQRFYREVEIVSRLQHPHILPVYDFGEQDGMPYIVMAYLSGGTLGDLMRRGPMNPAEAVRIVNQVADALDYAHGKGIIHRDFKPGNVLLDEQGNTYLADFGLARINERASNITGVTILGTPTYMAPEQTEPGELTPAADVYALGVTLYQMLTGQVPYDGPTPMVILMAHVTQPIPSIHALRPDLPDAVQTVINNVLAKDPEARYASAGEMARALVNAVEGEPVDALAENAAQAPVALLMTNMLGQVIFVDHICLRMLKRHQHEARHIIGRALHDVLGFDRSVTERLLQEIGRAGEISDWELNLRDARGTSLPAMCSAVATRDDKGNFVGADISLKPLVEGAAALRDGDFETVEKHLDTMEETYLQTYFKAQLEGLRNLLIELGGPRLGRNLEAMINETAERNVWPVSFQNGALHVQLRSNEADIYRALLAKAVAYAVNVIGKKVVSRQIEAVEKRLEPQVLQFVGDLGLRELYNAL